MPLGQHQRGGWVPNLDYERPSSVATRAPAEELKEAALAILARRQ
jgi:hypothetical protein